MKFFLDTEFIEDGSTIDLISIGIVREDGREFYAINDDCDWDKASDWVRENVLLPMGIEKEEGQWSILHDVDKFVIPHEALALEVMQFIKAPYIDRNLQLNFDPDNIRGSEVYKYLHQLECSEKIELWGYYSAYDHVAFCQLFGTMMDLPKGFPMYTRDLKQWADQLGNPKLPQQATREHHALGDANWNKQAWEFLKEIQSKL